MKHHNTKYNYAEGGFGAISIDLVRNIIVKESKKLADTSIRNEIKAYQILSRQSVQSAHILKLINSSERRLELERADCDLGYFARTIRGFNLGSVFDSECVFMLVLLQALEALSYVHECGLVHCDIKPSNILLQFDVEGNFIVKLCDFGLSHLVTDTRPIVKGTSGYTDPLSVINKAALTRRSDLWSLGVTMLATATNYAHIEELATKQLKNRAPDSAQEFVKGVVHKLVPDRSSAMSHAIYTLLTADDSQTCKSVLISILDNIQKHHQQLSARLANASFDDARLLANIPSIEYFKFISEDEYACLVDRTFLLSNTSDKIAVRDCNIYYTDQAFMSKHKQTVHNYLARFGFKSDQLKMKQITTPEFQNLRYDDNTGYISFDSNAIKYEIDPATGNQTVRISDRVVVYIHQQVRFVLKSPTQ